MLNEKELKMLTYFFPFQVLKSTSVYKTCILKLPQTMTLGYLKLPACIDYVKDYRSQIAHLIWSILLTQTMV